jgi:ABC-2 type transport system permease protein
MAFSNIENNDKLSVIDIAVVENSNLEDVPIIKSAIDTLSKKGSDEQLFNTKYVTKTKAKSLLEKSEITGYIMVVNDEPEIFIKKNSVESTIFKYAIEEIMQSKAIFDNITTDGKNAMAESMQSDTENKLNTDNVTELAKSVYAKTNVKIKDISPDKLSYTMIEYYTLIAMACLYGAMLGMTVVNYNMPSMGAMGKRVSISPVNKLKLIGSGVCAAYAAQLIGIVILYVFTILVLNVDYGDNFVYIVLLSLAGSLAGVALGIVVGALVKGSENAKTGIIISFTMVACFLSGMMGITMKYIIDTNIPVLNKINPVAMITDGLYSLYYYGANSRFYIDAISLLIFSGILIGLAFMGLRRQKYDSL